MVQKEIALSFTLTFEMYHHSVKKQFTFPETYTIVVTKNGWESIKTILYVPFQTPSITHSLTP